jgi:hypothetical protein
MADTLFLLLNQAINLTKKDILIVGSSETLSFPVHNKVFKKIIKYINLILAHIKMGQNIRKNKHRDGLIVYGFSTEFWLLAWVSSLFWTKNVYLQNHHNIQQACVNPGMKFLLKVYTWLGYRYIVNETASILKNIGYSEQQISQYISLPFPVIPEATKKILELEETPKKVGIVGQIRKGKQIEETLNLLINLQDKLNYTLVVGTNNLSFSEEINLEKVKLFNTDNREDYLAVLAACDVIVLNYEQEKYYYRCSGVAADAIGVHTYVICPDYPLMQSQILSPSPVGLVYHHETELESILQQVLELPAAKENPAFAEHYANRSITKIAEFLDQLI